MVNDLPWKWTKVILSFLRLHTSAALHTYIDYESYSIFSKGFLPRAIDIKIIWIKLSLPYPFGFTDFWNIDAHSCHLLLDHIQFTLIHGPNVPSSYAILFFTALDFTFTTRHIHNWASFPLWPSCFILSGTISLVIALCSSPAAYLTPSSLVSIY